MDTKFLILFVCSLLCFSAILIILKTTSHIVQYNTTLPETSECFRKFKNFEKFPNLYHSLVHNITFSEFKRLVFHLRLPSNLEFESKLVAASDSIEYVCRLSKFKTYPYNVTIISGKASSRNVTFYKCFDSSVIFNEIIQMNIQPMLQGGFVTLIFTKISKNNQILM